MVRIVLRQGSYTRERGIEPFSVSVPLYLRQIPTVETLRRTGVNQYFVSQSVVKLRAAKDLPPSGQRIDSPYDPEARLGSKRSTTWAGYKVHLTESCDNQTHLITHVITTPAHVSDVSHIAPIHAALAAKSLLPSEHIVDAGYVDASILVESKEQHGIKLIGPVRPDISWQANLPERYDISQFHIDWDAKRDLCPQIKSSRSWTLGEDEWGNSVIHVKFSRTDCRLCSHRALCTRSKTDPREITLRPQSQHQALQKNRQLQNTKEWKHQYDKRAGIEGTLPQDINVMGLRRSRYLGLAKTHLQEVFISVAVNFELIVQLLNGKEHAQTRTSQFAKLAPANA